MDILHVVWLKYSALQMLECLQRKSALCFSRDQKDWSGESFTALTMYLVASLTLETGY